MPIDFEIQQGLHFVFTNLPNLAYIQFDVCSHHNQIAMSTFFIGFIDFS